MALLGFPRPAWGAAADLTPYGDLWLDSDDGNKLYRWSGSAWVALPVGTGAIESGAATVVTEDASDLAGTSYGTGLSVVRSFSVTPAVTCLIEFTAYLEDVKQGRVETLYDPKKAITSGPGYVKPRAIAAAQEAKQ